MMIKTTWDIYCLHCENYGKPSQEVMWVESKELLAWIGNILYRKDKDYKDLKILYEHIADRVRVKNG